MAITMRGATRELRAAGRWLSPRTRVRGVFFVFVLLGLALFMRLFDLQVQQHTKLSTQAEQQHTGTTTIPASRGVIYDANGLLLAGNTTADDLYVEVSARVDIGERRRMADLLAPPLNANPDDVYARLSQQISGTIKLRGNLTAEQSARMRQLAADWPISLDPRPKRAYPNGNLLAHVLGYASLDNVGAYGLEAYFEKELGGSAGSSTAERDALGKVIPLGQQRVVPPVDGSDLTLTVDANVQYIAERALEQGLKDSQAMRGEVIIMNPQTGAILAMASRPTFDPNTYYQQDDLSAFINPAVSSIYEPGSTFKVLTWAMALNEGKVTPETKIDEPACKVLYKYKICNTTGEHPNETPALGLAWSDNMMALDFAEMLGKDTFYKYVKDFGLAQPSGITLPGNENGIVNFPNTALWSPLYLDTNAFGQGISITPLQLITAVAPIANGGRLMQPYIVQRISDKQGKVVQESQPKVLRTVLTAKTAAEVREMMVTVVEQGSAKLAGIKGYRMSVKTGTSQIPLAGGGYEEKDTIGSAVGFPSDDPRFLILVKLDRPQRSQWGEDTAVPVLANISRELFTYYKMQPTDYSPARLSYPLGQSVRYNMAG